MTQMLRPSKLPFNVAVESAQGHCLAQGSRPSGLDERRGSQPMGQSSKRHGLQSSKPTVYTYPLLHTSKTYGHALIFTVQATACRQPYKANIAHNSMKLVCKQCLGSGSVLSQQWQ